MTVCNTKPTAVMYKHCMYDMGLDSSLYTTSISNGTSIQSCYSSTQNIGKPNLIHQCSNAQLYSLIRQIVTW